MMQAIKHRLVKMRDFLKSSFVLSADKKGSPKKVFKSHELYSGPDRVLISVYDSHTQVACLETGRLDNLYVENSRTPSLVSSIYKARVIKNYPSIGACFVNIGENEPAFLYDRAYKNMSPSLFLQPGQELMVQVCKDSIKGKKPCVTTRISLPGRWMVYLPVHEQYLNSVKYKPPTEPYIGISRQVLADNQRLLLKEQMQKDHPGESFILRTLGVKASSDQIKKELQTLKHTWKYIQKQYQSQKKIGLIWKDLDLPARTLRDYLTTNTQEVLVDDEKTFQYLKQFVPQLLPEEGDSSSKIKFYQQKTSLFAKYHVEKHLSQLLEKKVWLKSGGFIVIEETEAGVMIDVNTGRFMGKQKMEKNILKTNLEAVQEIAKQIRLRNCGGIIIVDFIDMQESQSGQIVVEQLTRELEKDRTRTQVFPMSELGTVQMTRKRIRASLMELLCKPCPTCHGQAYIMKKAHF